MRVCINILLCAIYRAYITRLQKMRTDITPSPVLFPRMLFPARLPGARNWELYRNVLPVIYGPLIRVRISWRLAVPTVYDIRDYLLGYRPIAVLLFLENWSWINYFTHLMSREDAVDNVSRLFMSDLCNLLNNPALWVIFYRFS